MTGISKRFQIKPKNTIADTDKGYLKRFLIVLPFLIILILSSFIGVRINGWWDFTSITAAVLIGYVLGDLRGRGRIFGQKSITVKILLFLSAVLILVGILYSVLFYVFKEVVPYFGIFLFVGIILFELTILIDNHESKDKKNFQTRNKLKRSKVHKSH